MANVERFFNAVLNAHAPIRTKRVRNRDAPWITSDIRSMMFRREYLKKHAAKNRSEANWIEYCKLRNKVNNELKTRKEITLFKTLRRINATPRKCRNY